MNIKNLEREVLARLAEQAAAEGMSQQEWMRQILRRTADRLSPAELAAQHEWLSPMGEQEFSRLRDSVRKRRRGSVKGLNAPGSRG